MNMAEMLNSIRFNMFYNVRSQLQRFVYSRSEGAFDIGDAARVAITTPKQLEQRQESLRAKFMENLRGLPPMDTPLNAKTVGVVEQDGLTIEKVIFESRPGAFVTANLYIPAGI